MALFRPAVNDIVLDLFGIPFNDLVPRRLGILVLSLVLYSLGKAM